MQVCVVITARPSYSRVKTVLDAIRSHSALELQLVVSGSALEERYGAVVSQIEKDGYPIVRKLYTLVEGDSPLMMAKTTGLSLVELASTFEQLSPKLVLTVADRYETMATAIAASYMNIPLAHLQGGETTGSIDNRVRDSITKLADLHLVSSQAACAKVRSLNEPASATIVTGCPSIDIARKAQTHGPLSSQFIRRHVRRGEFSSLPEKYLVVMQHSDTTRHHETKLEILQTIGAIQSMNRPTFWFTPNVDAGSQALFKEMEKFVYANVKHDLWCIDNLPPGEFLRLIDHCECLIGNSSVGIRESAFLGVPVVNIGTRQTGRLRGSNVIDVEPDTTKILRAIRKQVRKGRYHSDDLYGDGYSGIRVAEAIFSFLENVLHDNSRGSNTGQSTQVLELDRFVA